MIALQGQHSKKAKRRDKEKGEKKRKKEKPAKTSRENGHLPDTENSSTKQKETTAAFIADRQTDDVAPAWAVAGTHGLG